MHTYHVEGSDLITTSTLLLTLKLETTERPLAFQPGQYAAISYERRGVKSSARCFSIVSSPTDQHTLQFSMRVRGRFTSSLSKLQKGDIVNVMGPFGGFVFDTTNDKKAIFLAGGIGITPFISMLRYLDALNVNNEVLLLYSCANQEDIPFSDELIAIQHRHPNLKTVFVVGTGAVDKLPSSSVEKGRITAEILDNYVVESYKELRFFICGPPFFMKPMTSMLLQKGTPSYNILTEAFTQSSPKQTSILRSWPANVYALGAIGLAMSSFIVMVSDLLREIPTSSNYRPTLSTPYLITNARGKQLDQLINTIPPSPDVINIPTTTQSQSINSQTINPQPQTLSPIYAAPLNSPPPTCQTTPSGRCI